MQGYARQYAFDASIAALVQRGGGWVGGDVDEVSEGGHSIHRKEPPLVGHVLLYGFLRELKHP